MRLGPERAPRTNAGVWSSRDGTLALLVLQTRAAGADTDAQQARVRGCAPGLRAGARHAAGGRSAPR